MTNLKHQKIANAKTKESLGNEQTISEQMSDLKSDFDDSPALVALEAKLLRRRRHETPHTYRRPDYLQYIEYV